MSPVRERVWGGAAWLGRGGGGVIVDPSPFVLGVTEPDATNTGPRVGVPREDYNGLTQSTWTISAPGEYSARNVHGNIVISAESGVYLHDVDLRVGNGVGNAIFFSNPLAHDHRIEYIRVWSDPADYRLNQGVRGGGYTMSRCDISGVADGAQIYTTSAYSPRTTRWLGNYVHGLVEVPDPGQTDGISHNDGGQIQGNIAFTAIGNSIRGGRTSAFIVTTDVSATYPVLEFTDNWLYGHPTQGRTINIAAGSTIAALKVWRNRIDPAGRFRQLSGSLQNRQSSAVWGMEGAGSDANAWTAGPNANVYIGTGAPVPVQNG